jgi:hypothetical protein
MYETSMEEREVSYVVCVPQEKVWTEMVTTYRQVAEPVTQKVTVCVPHQVEREVQVQCCRRVETTVQVPVCAPACCRRICCRRCGC